MSKNISTISEYFELCTNIPTPEIINNLKISDKLFDLYNSLRNILQKEFNSTNTIPTKYTNETKKLLLNIKKQFKKDNILEYYRKDDSIIFLEFVTCMKDNNLF